ncbi:MAG TPA: acetoacetate decarboxylase family protein [Acidimicrobiales bacterium]|nr:acetoacetate decarboxylase family protein [Acidimicrobiales bacterium]
MSQNRWVTDPSTSTPGGSDFHPVLPSLEVVYRTDPDVLAAVIPPPLEPPDEPRVHARVTEIHLEFGDFVHQERVGYFAVDAVYDGQLGEYPMLMPIDLEPAVSISREKFGEPKKLAAIEFGREGDHVEASVTRQDVTFLEIVGDVVETLPTPEPYPAVQWWFKFMPATVGSGFDAGPFLIRVDQVRSPQLLERVEGKLVLRDLPSCPVVDLPIVETESIHWTVRTATHEPTLIGLVDPVAFEPYSHSRYDSIR